MNIKSNPVLVAMTELSADSFRIPMTESNKKLLKGVADLYGSNLEGGSYKACAGANRLIGRARTFWVKKDENNMEWLEVKLEETPYIFTRDWALANSNAEISEWVNARYVEANAKRKARFEAENPIKNRSWRISAINFKKLLKV